MANPLIASAAEVDSQVEPATKFFDPSASLGIMQRYGMSGQSRAFAEDALKSANEIDQAVNYDPINRRNDLERHDWAREVQGRADVEYGRKKEQEAAFGVFAQEVYKLDFNTDPDAEKKLGVMASDPLLANYEPARAVLNHRFGELETRRKAAEQDYDYDKRFADELGSRGFTIVLDADGNLDRDKIFDEARKDKVGVAQDKAREKQRGEILDEIGEDNAVLLDQTYDSVNASRSNRAQGTVDAAAAQSITLFKTSAKEITDILDANPSLTKEAFVAQVVDLGKVLPLPAGTDPEGTAGVLAALTNRAELPAAIQPLVKSLDDTWAAHRVMLRNKPPNKKDPDATTGATTGAQAPPAAPPAAPTAAPKPKTNPRADTFFDPEPKVTPVPQDQ